MAAITSAASGNWSNPTTWTGGVVPTSADTVTILNGRTVTLDGVSCAADTLQTDVGSTLACITTASWTLTLQRWGHVNGSINFDMSAVPSNTGTLIYHAINNTTLTDGQFYWEGDASTQITLKGSPRTRITNLTSPATGGVTTTIYVDDATGWRAGDQLCFSTTRAYNATPKTDYITIAAGYTNGSTTVPLSSAVTNDHANDCYVGNLSSNLIVRPAVLTDIYCAFGMNKGYGGLTYLPKLLDNVTFLGGGNNNYQSLGAFTVGFTNGQASTDLKITLSNCAFDSFKHSAFYNHGKGAHVVPIPLTNCVFYSAVTAYDNATAISINDPNSLVADGCGIFRVTGTGSSFGVKSSNVLGNSVKNSFISGVTVGALSNAVFSNVHFFSNYQAFAYEAASGESQSCTFGTRFPGATNAFDDTFVNTYDGATRLPIYTFRDSTFAGAIGNCTAYTDYASVTVVNKGGAVNQQEIYRPFMTVKRDNGVTNRSTSSVAIYPTKTATDCTRTVSIPCTAGSSVTVVGYIRRSNANVTVAKADLTGLGASGQTFTSAITGQWEKYTFTATNGTGVDGNYTLTYTANAATTANSGTAYFDGVPDSPFVVKARHYGYTMDEANPARTVNPVPLVSEATAVAYTGVTVTASQITVGAGTANTFAKLYAYMQAHACANQTSTVNLTSSDGNNFALPLTYKLSWPTMGTDGTLVGGWLLLPSAGTYTHKLSGAKVDFTAAGTYDLSACTFGGSVEFVNSSGGVVTVSIPSGFTPVNTGPNITLSAPVLTTTVAAQVSLAGAEIRVYDLDNSPAGSLGTELAGTESCPGSTFSFAVAAGNNVWVQIMLANYKEYGQQLTGPSASTTYTFALTRETDA